MTALSEVVDLAANNGRPFYVGCTNNDLITEVKQHRASIFLMRETTWELMLLVAPVGMSLLFLGELTAPAANDIKRSCLSLLRLAKVVILLGPNQ